MFVDIYTQEDPKIGIPRKHIWGGFMTEIPAIEDTIRLHKEFEDRILHRRFDLVTGTVELELEADFLNMYTDIGEREEVDREEPWFPIETAPKDGTEIMLCQALDASGQPILDESWGIFVQIAAWWGDPDDEDGDWTVYCNVSQEPTVHFTPTHWKHIPKNPYWKRKE